MKQYELDRALAQNTEFNAVLLYGQSGYLISRYAKKIVQPFEGADIAKTYFEDYNFEYAKNFLSQSSLFGDKLIYWLTTDKKLDKKETEELIKAANKNNGLFIVQFLGDLSAKDSTFVNLFSPKSNSCEVRLFPSFKIEDSVLLLSEEAQVLKLDFERNALFELLNMQNSDLELSVGELGKFTHINHKIDVATVREIAGYNDQTQIDTLFDEIFLQKPYETTLERLLEKSGIDEMRILLGLQYALYELYQIFIRSRAGLDVSAKEVSGKNTPEFIWKNTIVRAVKIKESQYKKLLDIILTCEYELKTLKNADARLILSAHLIRFAMALK